MFVAQVWEYYEKTTGKRRKKNELLVIYKRVGTDTPKYTRGNVVAVLDPSKVSYKKLLSAGMALVVLPSMPVTLNDFGYVANRLEPFTDGTLVRLGVKQPTL